MKPGFPWAKSLWRLVTAACGDSMPRCARPTNAPHGKFALLHVPRLNMGKINIFSGCLFVHRWTGTAFSLSLRCEQRPVLSALTKLLLRMDELSRLTETAAPAK